MELLFARGPSVQPWYLGPLKGKTVFVTSFYISANYVTTLIFFFSCQFLDSVSIIGDADVPFQTAMVMVYLFYTSYVTEPC